MSLPDLYAHRLHRSADQLADWHAHEQGQLYAVSGGVLIMQTEAGHWVMPPGFIGWLPPRCAHAASGHGALAGWSAYLALPWCESLPKAPCVLAPSPLVQAIVARAAEHTGEEDVAQAQRRIAVLCDELRTASRPDLALSMPRDRRLLVICEAMLQDLGRPWSLAQWANWAGLSERSLSRHCLSETGLSFAQWRQQARLLRALEWLAQGQKVGEVAAALGYETPSSFIAVFQRQFGTTPGRYFSAT